MRVEICGMKKTAPLQELLALPLNQPPNEVVKNSRAKRNYPLPTTTPTFLDGPPAPDGLIWPDDVNESQALETLEPGAPT
jgi:hypothetical protein